MATPIPVNTAAFTLAEILASTLGTLAREAAVAAGGVSTDSRAVTDGNVFVAIEGLRVDGHDHVEDAVRRGARIVIARREVHVPKGVSLVLVTDTTRALGALGRSHRRRWARGGRDRRVIAITGSAGKTTTRGAVASLLANLGRSVHATKGNLNNQIGVPMSIFGLGPEHDVAVLEIGTNQRGEIAYNAGIAEPDIGVLTMVSDAHGEGIGSVWEIAKEKGDLLQALPARGAAIVNGDDARASAQLLRSEARTWERYGADPGASVRIAARAPRGTSGSELVLEVPRHPESRIEATIPLLGVAGAYAAAAAVTVALALDDYPRERIARALVGLEAPESGRLSAKERSDSTIVVDDAYNANPASMRASIAAASEIARSLDRRLVLVLGEMRELGPHAEVMHRELGAAIDASGAACLVAVAGAAKSFVDTSTLADRVFVPSVDHAESAVRERVRAGDVVLFKASNSIGLSRLAASLLAG
ncbi:MAG: UDP-N-acetylmuramoyl-tripeptide--D-alanyl-D-alanine ligase [Polyangiaceae bacterium]